MIAGAAVPEPTTVVLLLLGLGALVARRKIAAGSVAALFLAVGGANPPLPEIPGLSQRQAT